ncbi:Fe2+-enterobactin ABC transporter substrate-binding protein [Dermabacteraceae bacterium P13115]
MAHISRRAFGVSALSASLLGLSACGGEKKDDKKMAAEGGADNQSSGSWPRTIKHEKGELTLKAQPKRIVSTAITATGTLLAIDAPVVASAATTVSPLTNDKGFFKQWAKVAEERKVEVLYPNLEFNMEALIAADPDLVIVSKTGRDSVADHFDEIAAKFPAVLIDYTPLTWQELAEKLAEMTGHEEGAKKALETYDARVKEVASQITVPAGGASVVSFNGAGKEEGIGKPTGPHAQLLKGLGIEVKGAPEELDKNSRRQRKDFAFVSFENLSKAIQGETVFLIAANEKKAEKFVSEPTLANLPAVQKKQVYPLGITSFRIDYYSGLLMVDAVGKALKK